MFKHFACEPCGKSFRSLGIHQTHVSIMHKNPRNLNVNIVIEVSKAKALEETLCVDNQSHVDVQVQRYKMKQVVQK